MTHDPKQSPHVNNTEEVKQKRRIPVFILIIVGIFLAAIIFFMVSDNKPKAHDASKDSTVPAVQDPHSPPSPSKTE